MTNFVLIHGAYQGGWIWKPVAERLRAQGHHVLAPSLDGCAERKGQIRAGITTETHADEVAGRLFYDDLKDVVLVGTSTGGMVMARTAELARDRVARVVFADALALLDGEALPDIVKRPTAVDTEFGTGPSRHDFETRLFAGLDPTLRQWALDRCTPHPIGAMRTPVKLERFWGQSWNASVILRAVTLDGASAGRMASGCFSAIEPRDGRVSGRAINSATHTPTTAQGHRTTRSASRRMTPSPPHDSRVAPKNRCHPCAPCYATRPQ